MKQVHLNQVSLCVEIQFIGTNDQLANILTKPLPRIRFLEIKGKIGVAEIKYQRHNV
jgi:hypothetical protein